jgi:hypothetical protein
MCNVCHLHALRELAILVSGGFHSMQTGWAATGNIVCFGSLAEIREPSGETSTLGLGRSENTFHTRLFERFLHHSELLCLINYLDHFGACRRRSSFWKDYHCTLASERPRHEFGLWNLFRQLCNIAGACRPPST